MDITHVIRGEVNDLNITFSIVWCGVSMNFTFISKWKNWRFLVVCIVERNGSPPLQNTSFSTKRLVGKDHNLFTCLFCWTKTEQNYQNVKAMFLSHIILYISFHNYSHCDILCCLRYFLILLFFCFFVLKHIQEAGYLPEAVVNFVALLGWNPGFTSSKEVFTLNELIDAVVFQIHCAFLYCCSLFDQTLLTLYIYIISSLWIS